MVNEVRSLKHYLCLQQRENCHLPCWLTRMEVRTRWTSDPSESCRRQTTHVGKWGYSSLSERSKRSYVYILYHLNHCLFHTAFGRMFIPEILQLYVVSLCISLVKTHCGVHDSGFMGGLDSGYHIEWDLTCGKVVWLEFKIAVVWTKYGVRTHLVHITNTQWIFYI